MSDGPPGESRVCCVTRSLQIRGNVITFQRRRRSGLVAEIVGLR